MSLFNNKENELHSFEQTIEKLKADYAKLEQENISKEEEIKHLKKVIESLNENSSSKENIVTNEPILEESKQIPEIEATPVVTIDYTPALDAIKATLDELKAQSSEIKTQLGYRDIQDENMRAMHKEMERYKADFFAKITQPYLIALLDLHKRFFETYSHFDHLDNSEADMSKLYNDLMGQFKSAVDALENRIYNDFGVEYYIPQVGDDFNPKEHQAFEVITTENESNNRKVAKVIYGGFRDLESGKILRPARIACYKYQIMAE